MGILGGLSAANQGLKAANSFEAAYRETFHEALPSSAKESIQSAVTIILAHSGSGNEAYGKQKLEVALDNYRRAVGPSETKVAAGFAAVLGVCMNRRGKVAFGYGWAADVVAQMIMLYCPNSL